ncbi:outer membrane protein assembly factor BamB family protein [Oryzibacter oryziterrae]|uniref:outer membrane protein assembly factor BamB family protein n=1 Tax=Oryzibacter oryziterrae TaxID=2766474 RepID=UPI001F3E476A|nr:PQQ-binding-like beta-propeller repeat protein [Oryzibacter oryziterrae]
MQLHPLIASLLRLIVLVFLLPAAASAASLTLSRTSGPPTTAVVLTGKSFTPNSIVDIYFDTQQIAFRLTSSTGGFTYSTSISGSAQPGAHDFTVLPHVAGGKFAQTSFKVQTSWTSWRNGTGNRGWNKTENVLDSYSIRSLDTLWRAPMNTYSTPLVSGDIVVSVNNDSSLSAYSMKTHAKVYSIPGTTALADRVVAPVLANGYVIYAGTGKLFARKVSDGSLVWKAVLPPGVGAPVVSGSVVYVVAQGGAGAGVYAFSVTCRTGGATCTPIWHSEDGNSASYYFPERSLAVGYDRVFAILSNKLYAYDVGCATGGGICTSTEHWDTVDNTAPTVANGYVYVTYGTTLFALPPECINCGALWTGTLPEASSRVVAASGDQVFVVTGSKLVAFKAGCEASPCAPLWSTTVPGSSYSPVIASSLVYVASPRQLAAFPANCYADCKSVWHTSANATYSNANYAGPAIVDGKLLVSSVRNVIAYGLPESAQGERSRVKVAQLKPSPKFAKAERALLLSLARRH